MAFISLQLGIRSGSVVVESGTGSGSFTHSLARLVGTSGHVHTFEFHEQRATLMKQQFLEHRMGETATIYHRDVCKTGFGETVAGRADAVFLDLPSPWEAIEHAKRAMRKDRTSRIACYSPCIEQVQKTIEGLEKEGFKDITMYTCLLREYNVRRVAVPVWDPTGEATPAASKAPHSKRIKAEELGETKLIGEPKQESRGHTSFLTFAALPCREDAGVERAVPKANEDEQVNDR